MDLLKQIFGNVREPQHAAAETGVPEAYRGTHRAASEHHDADTMLDRYRLLLRTAPPEVIEQAHAEAFAQLSPAERIEVLRRLNESVPDYERYASQLTGPSAQGLARIVTRTELRNPGSIERALGPHGHGLFNRSISLGPSILAGIIAGALASAVAQEFFVNYGDEWGTATDQWDMIDGVGDSPGGIDDHLAYSES